MRVQRGARAVEHAGRLALARAAESGPPRDEYGELATALREGRRKARDLGHELTKWKKRPYAPNTAATAYCRRCGAVAGVNLENASHATGAAVSKPCTKRPTTDEDAAPRDS